MPTFPRTHVALALAVAAAAVGLGPATARADRPASMTIAIYAPTMGFDQSRERLAYLERVAKAIEAKTGIPTAARSYARYGDLIASKPDFAVVPGLCVAARGPGPVVATAVIDGATSREWGVFAAEATTVSAARGQRVAHASTGCRDGDFLDNVAFGGELRTARYFASIVSKADTLGAVAAVRHYKEADLVIAPRSLAASLTLVMSIGDLPNPAFVQLQRSLDAALVAEVKAALLATEGSDESWRAPASYTTLGNRLGGARRSFVAAAAEPIRIDLQRMAAPPATGFAQAGVGGFLWSPRRTVATPPARP